MVASSLGPPPLAVPHPRRWAALVLLCAANFMIILDSQIVILALPAISADLAMSPASAQWVLSANLLAFGGLLLLGGRAADLLGRRRMFLVGTALFLAISLLSGFAWSAGVLIAARALHGVSAALMAPTALAILTDAFPDGPDRHKALAGWAGIASFGAVTGLLAGGALTELGWQWVFLVNVPVALIMLVLAPVLLPESRDRDQPRTFDLAGAATSTGALVLLLYAIVLVPTAGWLSTRTLALLAGAIVLLAAFVAIESRSKAPLVPLHLFRSRSLVGGNLAMLAVGMLPFGLSVTMSQYAQTFLGLSAWDFGLRQVVMPLSATIGAYAGHALVTRWGVRAVAGAGMVAMAAGALLLLITVAAGQWRLDTFAGLAVFGAGMGVATVAAATAALAGVQRAHAGLASGLNTAALQSGGGFGVAVVVTVIASFSTIATGDEGGYRAGFIACAVIALVTLAITWTLLRSRPTADID
ncbi:MFS transporter [Catenuloplanes indicus]|uniref:MFS family permease n=1 Tax=Catenuloplanes indicus TaxID=137267 RepID=A0AAE3VUJ3_9ACTN|nr:MFS transporter [Catenuloplanes indicus]MDQ0364423.1 MFS family permease [Catenuloplanes indicus]